MLHLACWNLSDLMAMFVFCFFLDFLSFWTCHNCLACQHSYVSMLAWLSRYVDTFDGKITSTKGAQKYVTINLASFFTSTFGEFQTGLIKKNCLWFSGNSKRGRIVSLPGRDQLPCPALYSLWGTGSQTTPPTYLFTSHTCVIFLLVNLSYVSSEFRAIELLIGPLFSPCVHDFW